MDLGNVALATFDPEIGIVPKPNARTHRIDGPTPNRGPLVYDIYTDDRGARVDTPGQNSPGNVDMMVIGCSFTFGHPIQNPDTYLDLTSAFERHRDAGEKVYVVDDGHPNEAAHAIIADEIERYVRHERLL